MMTDGPSVDLKQPARWGLDVKVEGISNVTGLGDVMAIDQDSTPQGELGSPSVGGGANSALVQEWLPPVRLGQEDRVGLGDVPPLRHVWNMVSALFFPCEVGGCAPAAAWVEYGECVWYRFGGF